MGYLDLPAVTAPMLLARFDTSAFDASTLTGLDRDALALVPAAVPKRQAEFVAGRWAARALLARFGQAETLLGVGAHREPIWPAGWIGSISHAAGHVAATVARSEGVGGIGIDLERLVDAEVAETLSRQVVDENERALLAGCGMRELEAMTVAFSAKESFFKAAFATVREYFDFDAVRITRIDAAAGVLELTTTRALARELPGNRCFQARFDWIEPETVMTALAW